MHSERRAEQYRMSEKRVIVFIVEGPSEEAALGSVMKEYFSGNEVQFVVVHGDITLNDYVSAESILIKVNEQIERVKSRYRYRQEDFIKIIHLADMDGVYIQDDDIRQADVEEIRYFEEHIEANNVKAVAERNKRKAAVLYKLRKTGKIKGISYRIYFNSCNLEHVLYNELKNFTDEEKQILSDDFADRYDGKADEFIKFISDPEFAVPGTYQKTWDYIEKEKNSLKRHSNMHLIFE